MTQSHEIFLFITIQFIALFFVIFLLFCINTIYCLFSLIGIIFCSAILLLFAECEFFALIYLLIYVGAIIVFFLFTIMLLHLKFERIFEFEVSYAMAIPCLIILNFIINYYIIHDFSYLENSRASDIVTYASQTNLFFDIISSGYEASKYRFFGHDVPTFHRHNDIMYSSIWNNYAQSGAYVSKFGGFTEPANYKIIGFVMYEKFGYLCFLIGFILLMTMIGIMELIKYAREDAAKPYELTN